MLCTEVNHHNYAYLKKLGTSYKLILCNSVRKKGYENVDLVDGHANFSCENSVTEKVQETDSEYKLANNICRARNKVFEYVLCNDFVFFVTLTLNKEKYDRTDLKKFNKDWGIFIRDYNKRKNADIKYVLIPEQHKDGCWHMHGFIMGLPYDRLELFDLYGERPLPSYIVKKLKKNELLFNFPEYEKRFGFNIFEPIRNKKASVLYMSKYMTKDMSRNVTELGGHLYYCSKKGLKKAEIIKQGQFLDSDFDFDFKNEYGAQSFFEMLAPEQLETLKEKIGGAPLSIDDYRKGYRKKDGWVYCHDMDTGEIFGNSYKELEAVFSG